MSDKETKTFQTSVVVSLASCISLCRFDKMHECAEWVAGHPIWTHEFASEALWNRLRDLITYQHPWLDDEAIRRALAVKGDAEAARALAQSLDAEHGELSLARGDDQRKADPVETLREVAGDKPVIVVGVDEESSR